jgi:hypothetical protein
MKRLLAIVLAVLVGPITPAFAGRSLNLDPNQSGAIAIGTSTTAPTQIFTNDEAANRTCVINTSTNTVFFVGFSTFAAAGIGTNGVISTNATTGSFAIPGSGATVPPITFCFDGVDGPFTGPLWAVCATGGNVIQRIRTH